MRKREGEEKCRQNFAETPEEENNSQELDIEDTKIVN